MRWLWILVFFATIWAPARAAPLAEQYMDGRIGQGEQALSQHLLVRPDDDQARFGLGTLQFLSAIETLCHSLYRHGLHGQLARELGIAFLRLPLPEAPKPEAVTYEDLRKMLEDLIVGLQRAETTLSGVKDDKIKLPLHLGRIKLNLGEGVLVPLTHLVGTFRPTPAENLRGGSITRDAEWLVVFDRGDVAWLRGYCHLLMGMAEFALAHDGRELFDDSAQLFFARPQGPYATLLQLHPKTASFEYEEIIDLISFIHVIRLPVQEPQREQAVLDHLQQMVVLSQESWRYILAETDDDHEWIPNPRQKSSLGGKVTQEMVDSWLAMLAELGPILEGKRLVPFWRAHDPRGVNLRRVFLEPRTFDLVLWIQGTAAVPYLESGPVTSPAVWREVERIFQGNFFGFAIWFN